MRTKILFMMLVSLACCSTSAFADPLEDQVKDLEKALKQQEQTLQELKVRQETMKQQEQVIEQQRKQIEKLQAEIKQSAPPPSPASSPSNEPTGSEKLEQQVQGLKEKVDEVVEAQKKVIPSMFNPAIGFVGESILSYSSEPSEESGIETPGGCDFFQRTMELDVSASVDPFVRAYAVFNAWVDAATGEAGVGVEEAAAQTECLPWNLTLKAGRFFGEFGRLSYVHDHELPFVTRPLVLDQYVGGESVTDGVQINWLVPVPHYISLTLGFGNQFGDLPNDVAGFRHLSGWNYFGRLSTYFDLTPDIALETGLSGLWNPDTDGQWASPGDINPPFPTVHGIAFTERERRLGDIDLEVSWRPLRNNEFQALTWGTEALYSNNRYDLTDPEGNPLPSEMVGSWGLYSYLTYRWHRQWSGGVEYQWLEDLVDSQARTSAYSAFITWAISHWNQLRLEYSYTDPNGASGLCSSHAVYLQWAWIIGSHAHGWQQR